MPSYCCEQNWRQYRSSPVASPLRLGVRQRRQELVGRAGLLGLFQGSRGAPELPDDLQQFVDWSAAEKLPPQPVCLKTTPTDGRGLYAKRRMFKGESVVKVPRSLLLSAEVAAGQSRLRPVLSSGALPEWTVLAVFLVELKLLGSQPGLQRWDNYMRVLPRDVNTVLSWTDEQVSWLLCSPLHAHATEIRNAAEASLSEALPLLHKAEQAGLVPPTTLSNPTLISWAFEILLSRLIRLPTLDAEALVPWADFLNHDPSATCFIDWDLSAGAVTLKSDRSYNAGEQVFASYGQKSSGELLLSYGFVPGDNPFDSVKLTIAADAADGFAPARIASLAARGLCHPMVFPLRLDSLPAGMLEYAAVLVAQVESAGEVDELTGDVLSGGLTKKRGKYSSLGQAAATHVIALCQAALAAYPTSLESDRQVEAQLAGKDDAWLQRAVVGVRMKEKKVLNRTVFILQQQRKSFKQ